MSSPDDFPKSELGNERIPSREEIWAQILKRCEGAEVVHELSQGTEVYFLETRVPGERTGEFVHYVYQRKGTFPGGYAAASTVLEKVYLVDGDACGGEIVAEYDGATGEWSEV